MPTLTGEVLGKTDLNGAGVSDMISSSCEHPEAAWKFLEFMNDGDYLAEYQKEGYGLVVVPAVAEIAEPSDTYGSNISLCVTTSMYVPRLPIAPVWLWTDRLTGMFSTPISWAKVRKMPQPLWKSWRPVTTRH